MKIRTEVALTPGASHCPSFPFPSLPSGTLSHPTVSHWFPLQVSTEASQQHLVGRDSESTSLHPNDSPYALYCRG